MSIFDDALVLIDEARQLKTAVGGGEKNRSPSWQLLKQSADKYNEAVFYLNNYVRRIVRQNSTGSEGSDESAETRDLIARMIGEHEMTASRLNEQAEQEQQRQEQEQWIAKRINYWLLRGITLNVGKR